MPTKPADLSLRFSAKSAALAICLTTLGPLFFATAFSSVAVAQGQQATMQAAERAAMEAQGGPSGYEEMEPGYDDMDMYDAEMEDQGMGDPYGESGYGSGYGGQSNSRGGGDLKPSPTVMLEVFFRASSSQRSPCCVPIRQPAFGFAAFPWLHRSRQRRG